MANIFGHDKGFNIEQVPTYSQYTTLNTKVSALDTKVTQILGGGFGQRTIYNTLTPKTNMSGASVVNGGLDIKTSLIENYDWEVYNSINAVVDSSYSSIDINGWAYINKNGLWQNPQASDAMWSWGLDLLNLGDYDHLNMPIIYKKADSQGNINWQSPNRTQRWRFNAKDMFNSGLGNPDSEHSNWKFTGDIEYSNPKYDLMKPYGNDPLHPYEPKYTCTLTVHGDGLSDWGEVRTSRDGFTRYLSTGTTDIFLGDTLRVIVGSPQNAVRILLQNRWVLGTNDVHDYVVDGDVHIDVYPFASVTVNNGQIYVNGNVVTPYVNSNPGYSWKGAFVSHNSTSVDSQNPGTSPVSSWWLVPAVIANYTSEWEEGGIGAIGPGPGAKALKLDRLPPETTIKYHVTLNILHPGGD